MLATVERWGIPKVTESTLRHWQQLGIIPNPTIEGPSGGERALYPWWAVDLVALVLYYRARGHKLGSLGPRMRAAAWWLSNRATRPRYMDVSRAAYVPLVEPWSAASVGDDLLAAAVWSYEHFTGPIIAPLNKLAEMQWHNWGVEVERIEVRLYPTEGEPLVFEVPRCPDDAVPGGEVESPKPPHP